MNATPWHRFRAVTPMELSRIDVMSDASGGYLFLRRSGTAYMKVAMTPAEFVEFAAHVAWCARRLEEATGQKFISRGPAGVPYETSDPGPSGRTTNMERGAEIIAWPDTETVVVCVSARFLEDKPRYYQPGPLSLKRLSRLIEHWQRANGELERAEAEGEGEHHGKNKDAG